MQPLGGIRQWRKGGFTPVRMGSFSFIRMDIGHHECSSTYEQESAFDLYLQLEPERFRLKCGCEHVDRIFHQGIIQGEIIELVGSTAVGKSQMCFSLTASVLLAKNRRSSHVVYIDTNGSFRSTRLLQILVDRGQSKEIAMELLSRVLVKRVYDEDDLRRALIALQKFDKSIDLIVIDSIGFALAQTALTYFEGGKEMQEQIIVRLHRLSRQLGCAIVTTNHLVYRNNYPFPSLGYKWKDTVHSRFVMLDGDRAYYQISDSGIVSLCDDEITEQTQKTQKIINENWDTIMCSLSQIDEANEEL
ncbi:unnamed protein product [Anisakis simplex]|uniref:RAD51-like protein 1 (inferred by orthology to a C. elegans protein) n=1 Tax=Anisakis simplex TaxID=6269 RepID=A0A0M3J0E3_ANISI|nr:unnamed protein product [Anisakis simplex]